jgi:hypothetical protein
MIYTGCLYDPSSIHNCVQVRQAATSAEAYGWELPVHDLRTLASKMKGIDVCVEHTRVAIGVVEAGLVDEDGKLQCCFKLFRDETSPEDQTNTKMGVVDLKVAEVVDRWIKAGSLRELSLQHVRRTLEPLEVSIVVAGARPNSIIHGLVKASAHTKVSGRGNRCKRTPREEVDAIVTITASQKSNVQTMNHIDLMSNSTQGSSDNRNPDTPESFRLPKCGAREEGGEGGEGGEEEDVCAAQVAKPFQSDKGDNLQQLLLSSHVRTNSDTHSKCLLATEIKRLLSNVTASNGSEPAIAASAQVEEDQLAAATDFVHGRTDDVDFISRYICASVKCAIDVIENAESPSKGETMDGHSTPLAASLWLSKLCEVDRNTCSASYVHELDLISPSREDLTERIKAMFVPSCGQAREFDVTLARALTGTLRRASLAIGAYNTRTVAARARYTNTAANSKTGSTKQVRASIRRDFATQRQQRPPSKSSVDPFKPRLSKAHARTSVCASVSQDNKTVRASKRQRPDEWTNERNTLERGNPWSDMPRADAEYMMNLFNEVGGGRDGGLTLRPLTNNNNAIN